MRIIDGNSTVASDLLTPVKPVEQLIAKEIRTQKKHKLKLVILCIVLAVFLLLATGAFFLFRNYKELRSFKNERDVATLTKKLEKHLEIPSEEPIIATVTDVEKLKSEQAFYRNAKNGDKIFIWKDKALIYRVETDKIIDFGIIVTQKAEKTEPTISPTPTEVKK
jgi:predicted membrane protein